MASVIFVKDREIKIYERKIKDNSVEIENKRYLVDSNFIYTKKRFTIPIFNFEITKNYIIIVEGQIVNFPFKLDEELKNTYFQKIVHNHILSQFFVREDIKLVIIFIALGIGYAMGTLAKVI